ncbi:hypothetical protein KPL70_004345 [Citrus sinensis]|nr:hypothetical protein KPL70_004345 [Citrus sinensis]
MPLELRPRSSTQFPLFCLLAIKNLPSNSEPLFYLLGFLVCIGSTTRRASKSAIQQILLTSKAEKINSINLLVYMALMAASIFLPFTLYIEGMWQQLQLRKLEKTNSLCTCYLGMPPLLIWNLVIVMGMTEFAVTTMIAVLYSKVKKRFKISTH